MPRFALRVPRRRLTLVKILNVKTTDAEGHRRPVFRIEKGAGRKGRGRATATNQRYVNKPLKVFQPPYEIKQSPGRSGALVTPRQKKMSERSSQKFLIKALPSRFVSFNFIPPKARRGESYVQLGTLGGLCVCSGHC
ncbi:hypothetical protein EVAR_39706_1 [Eumeta japonica]|uniref:Uncharacterized protein n=1 Tax=Eumeta variegata TaxID=151549 RepID=A0A4C1W718_EUMVA|nr:hypothetical protein EVAR_39706_1 [Eumeta japonica]